MAEVNLVAAFSTVPGGEADAITQLLTDTIQQIAQDDGTFKQAKIVFTESDERCGLTAELDGINPPARSARTRPSRSRTLSPFLRGARYRGSGTRGASGSGSRTWRGGGGRQRPAS
jgi:hypothetical protein